MAKLDMNDRRKTDNPLFPYIGRRVDVTRDVMGRTFTHRNVLVLSCSSSWGAMVEDHKGPTGFACLDIHEVRPVEVGA